MFGNSSHVTSAQTAIHKQLAFLVERHAAAGFRKPVMPYNRLAFESAMKAWEDAGCPPLILDAGCGVGLSTLHLATMFPDHFVIGVDQSANRLARNTPWLGEKPANLIRLRADLVDFWRLMHASGIYPVRQYVLYPNPWPKIGHLGRRWHGHPVFPAVLALGGFFECRSNWRIYIEECAFAIGLLTGLDIRCEPYFPPAAITPFEQKYLASGHTLWRCRANLRT